MAAGPIVLLAPHVGEVSPRELANIVRAVAQQLVDQELVAPRESALQLRRERLRIALADETRSPLRPLAGPRTLPLDVEVPPDALTAALPWEIDGDAHGQLAISRPRIQSSISERRKSLRLPSERPGGNSPFRISV